MRMTRQELEAALEAFTLDLLDADSTKAFERALADHPDLAQRVATQQRALAGLAYDERTIAPPPLRQSVLAAAERRRTPGRGVENPDVADGPTCHRLVSADVSELLDDLEPDDMRAETIYGIPVVELIRHLNGVEAYLVDSLPTLTQATRMEDPTAGDHRSVRDHSDASDPAAVVSEWRRTTRDLAGVLSSWTTQHAEARASLGELSMDGNTLLVARAFELWIHAEDIARAARRPMPVPPVSVLSSMADASVDMIVPLLGARQGSIGKTIRITLTGPGGGSWIRTVPEPGTTAAALPDAFARADATVVADVVDFCHLVADRIPPDVGLDAHRQGDPELLGDLDLLAPSLADFGAGPLPR